MPEGWATKRDDDSLAGKREISPSFLLSCCPSFSRFLSDFSPSLSPVRFAVSRSLFPFGGIFVLLVRNSRFPSWCSSYAKQGGRGSLNFAKSLSQVPVEISAFLSRTAGYVFFPSLRSLLPETQFFPSFFGCRVTSSRSSGYNSWKRSSSLRPCFYRCFPSVPYRWYIERASKFFKVPPEFPAPVRPPSPFALCRRSFLRRDVKRKKEGTEGRRAAGKKKEKLQRDFRECIIRGRVPGQTVRVSSMI